MGVGEVLGVGMASTDGRDVFALEHSLTRTRILETTQLVSRLGWIDQVAGLVWVFLTLLMIACIYLLRQPGDRVWHKHSYHVLALIVMVWLYPIYTLGFKLVPGLIGNIVVAVLAIYVTAVVASRSMLAASLLLPTIGWLAAATFYVSLLVLQPT